MTFSTLTFLALFLPGVMIPYFLCPRKWLGVRNTILLITSVLFYAWGEPANVILILICVSLTYLVSFMVVKKSVFGLVLGILINLVPLIVFKYANFLVLNVNNLFGLDIPSPGLTLPIGISFYTFQILTYVVDLYRGTVKLQRNPAYLTLYVFFFPQLIAGPIVRYSDIELELNKRHSSVEDIWEGVQRFIVGLAKKMLVANQAGFIVSTIQGQQQSEIGAGLLWISVISYGVQIYFDFSGYSDMAIGLGRIFGFHFLENFQKPYMARSITEFWRRWHISLSTFFRDYIYIPMGGNGVVKDDFAPGGKRARVWVHIRNLFIVWGLTGLWHGASWNFVLWGLYYFALLTLEKYVYGKWLERMPAPASRLITCFFYTVGWAIFMTETNSFVELGHYLARLFGAFPAAYPLTLRALTLQGSFLVVILGLILSMFDTPKLVHSLRERYPVRQLVIRSAALLGLLALCVLFIVGESFNPFIYFRF